MCTVYPNVLVLSVKRFVAEFDPKRPQGLVMRKRTDSIDAPLNLDFNKGRYKLKAIGFHHGRCSDLTTMRESLLFSRVFIAKRSFHVRYVE